MPGAEHCCDGGVKVVIGGGIGAVEDSMVTADTPADVGA
jgi:hypothetical protein